MIKYFNDNGGYFDFYNKKKDKIKIVNLILLKKRIKLIYEVLK